MRLSISLLGSFQVTREGTAVTKFGYDKVRALLAYLAVHANQPIPREQIAALLWQDQTPEAALHSLSQALLKLRRALKDPAAESVFVQAERASVELRLTARDGLDTRALEDRLDECERHPHRAVDECEECIERMQKAVALYRGDFLEGVLVGDSAGFEDWVIMRREHYRRRVLGALDLLTHYFTDGGDYERAEVYARRQIELEPYLEEAHRALMLILGRCGKRAAALGQYENCKRLLAQELGIEPSPETTLLYERLRALGDARPHNLQLPLPVLIGRERESARIAERLADPECRLLTLAGPGGIGKTTLALNIAQANLPLFFDGVWIVWLEPVAEPALLPAAIAGALSLTLHGESEASEQVMEYLSGKHVLLVLDNFEHLMAGREFLLDLVREAPQVKLLVTSRVPLDLRAEWVLRVEGLDFEGDTGSRRPRDIQAVRLFKERARRVSAAFAPDAADEREIVQICSLLWGSPLGIELAAGWTGALSCREIAQEIRGNPDFLATAAGDVPARHHSLRAVFDQSWMHLDQVERGVLRRLAVFQLAFVRPAAQAVTGVTVFQLSALVNKSWLRLGAEERYALHPLLKQFLAEKLAEHPAEEHALREKHAMYFEAWMKAQDWTKNGLSQQPHVHAMREVSAELSAAMEWAAETRTLRVLEAIGEELYNFIAGVGQYEEGIRLFAQTAHALKRHPLATRDEQLALAKQYGFCGTLELLCGAYDDARSNLETSLELARSTGDRKQFAFCVHSMARLALAEGHVSRARDLSIRSLELREQAGDFFGVLYSRYMLGNIALEIGPYSDAYAHYAEGLASVRAKGHTDGLALVIPLNGLGAVAYQRGQPELAQRQLLESLRLSRAIGHAWCNAEVLKDLALLSADRGDYAQAEAYAAESLDFYNSIGKRGETGHALRAQGWLAECQGDPANAQKWYEASHTRFEQARQKTWAPMALVDLARMLAVLGDPAQAESLLRRAHAMYAEMEHAHGLMLVESGLGIAARARAEPERAFEHFASALRLAVENEQVYEGLKTLFEVGSLLEERGDASRAVPLFAFLVQQPATPQHLRTLAAAICERVDPGAAARPVATSDPAPQALTTILDRVLL